MSNKKLIFIFLIIITVSAAYIFISNTFLKDGETVYIYIDNKIVKSIPLKSVSEPYDIKIGDGNTLHVEHDGVSMKDADCPDKLCIKQGKIKNSFVPIVCLPNKVIVKLGGDNRFDAISGR